MKNWNVKINLLIDNCVEKRRGSEFRFLLMKCLYLIDLKYFINSFGVLK